MSPINCICSNGSCHFPTPSKACAITLFVLGILLIACSVGLGQAGILPRTPSIILTASGSLVGAISLGYGLYHLICSQAHTKLLANNEQVKQEVAALKELFVNGSGAHAQESGLPSHMGELVTEYSGSITQENFQNYCVRLQADIDQFTKNKLWASFEFDGTFSPGGSQVSYKLCGYALPA